LNLEIFLVLIFGFFFFFFHFPLNRLDLLRFFLVNFSLSLLDFEILLVLIFGFFVSLKSLELLGIRFWDLFSGLIFSFYAHQWQ
jgi:hypothetical protein